MKLLTLATDNTLGFEKEIEVSPSIEGTKMLPVKKAKTRDIITLLFLLIAVVALCLTCIIFLKKSHITNGPPSISQAPNYVYKTLHPKQYFGVNVDIGQLIPGSPYYVKNSKGEDLIDIAHDLGINMFRIDNAVPPNLNNQSIPTYTKAQWDKVLKKMNKDGISAVVLIESRGKGLTYTQNNYDNSYLNLVKNYIIDPKVCNNPDVYGIDIANEPTINAYNLTYFRQASQMIKAACPNTKITIGGWRSDNGQKNAQGIEEYTYNDPVGGANLASIIDFYAVHIYGFDKETNGVYPNSYALTTSFLNNVRSYADNKPILIEEFGAANGDAISDQTTVGSPQVQENAYAGVLEATRDMASDNVIGAVSYLFYPRGSHPDSWNILKNNGDTILPAATLFAKALDQTWLYQTILQANLPQDQVLTMANNNSTVNTTVGGDIGFHLLLPHAAQNAYSVSLEDLNNTLTTSESLVPGWQANYYDTVLHTQKTGTAQVIIKEDGISVYHVTVVVNQ